MRKIIVELDSLMSVCGYGTSQTDANNGYGCNHPDQEEFEMLYEDKDGYTHRGYEEDETKKETRQGKCYSWSCPLAHECDLQDLKENDAELYEEWKDSEYEPNEAGAQLMLICNEDLIKKLK